MNPSSLNNVNTNDVRQKSPHAYGVPFDMRSREANLCTFVLKYFCLQVKKAHVKDRFKGKFKETIVFLGVTEDWAIFFVWDVLSCQ